jgi:hypothetical protein
MRKILDELKDIDFVKIVRAYFDSDARISELILCYYAQEVE